MPFHRTLPLTLLCCAAGIVFLFLSGDTAVAQDLPIRFTSARPPAAPSPPVYRPHQISRQNLLRLNRPAPHRLPRPKPAGAADTPQTLRILALRVDFPPDTTSKTTGDGRFDYRTPEQFEQQEGHVIDRAPHDRLYFERHLAAMKSYYAAASFEQLDLAWRVAPDGLQNAYTLPHEMAYYSPDVDFFDPLKLERLVEFVSDAFAAADQDPAIAFADYDAYIIFHAGSDLQHDRLGDSPSDLQSGFLRIGDERPPVRVDGGTREIREMILMPETTSQDGNIGALNATLTHEFGHQLGLPDLYSTFSFAAGVGPFDLMDLESGTVDIGESGQQIVTGALPTGLSAWSRAFLGWGTPQEVAGDSLTVSLLAALHRDAGVKALRVPIAPGEYFLIENRQTDLDGDGVAFLNFQDGIIVGPSNAHKQPNREYDYLLPGAGVLIWHVDENVAFGDFDGNGESNWVENALQWDEQHRFLDVEEADGIQDLGFTTDPARAEDLYYVGNRTVFGPATAPDSRQYGGGNSHVTVRVNSAPRLYMGVTVIRAHGRSGWPVALGAPAAVHAPALTDVDGDGRLETFMASPDGRLYAWRHDGAKLIANGDAVKTVTFTGDTVMTAAAVFAEAAEGFFTAPAVADLEGDGPVEVVSTDAAWVYAWQPRDLDGDGRADAKPGFPVRLIPPSSGGPGQTERVALSAPVLFRTGIGQAGIAAGTSAGGLIALRPDGSIRFSTTLARTPGERLIAPPAAADLDGDGLDEFLVALSASGAGRVQAADSEGRLLWSRPFGPAGRASAPLVADLDGDGAFDVVVAGTDGVVSAWDRSGTPLPGWPAALGSGVGAPPAAGDLDGDGLPEIAVSGDNRLYVLHGHGVPVTGFPVVIDRVHPAGAILSSPALGDVDGDGMADLVVGLPDGTVAAFHGDGQPAAGFPLGTSGAVSSSPALGDLTGDGDMAVVVGSDDGFVHLWTFSGRPDVLPWPMLAHDARRTGASAAPAQAPPPGDGPLLAAASVFCYPNPVNAGSTGIRYTLNRPADRVRIRIFSLAGELVDEMEGTPRQDENEVRWPVGRVASGVYLCQVEARDQTGLQTAFCKIAVVK